MEDELHHAFSGEFYRNGEIIRELIDGDIATSYGAFPATELRDREQTISSLSNSEEETIKRLTSTVYYSGPTIQEIESALFFSSVQKHQEEEDEFPNLR